MNIKKCIEVIARAEKSGLKIVVDAASWDGPALGFPLFTDMSPPRCELVAEARRLADSLDRPATPPEGCVYRHEKSAIEAAVKKAAAHIETAMKEQGNAESSSTVAKGDEQPDASGASRPSGAARSGDVEGGG